MKWSKLLVSVREQWYLNLVGLCGLWLCTFFVCLFGHQDPSKASLFICFANAYCHDYQTVSIGIFDPAIKLRMHVRLMFVSYAPGGAANHFWISTLCND